MNTQNASAQPLRHSRASRGLAALLCGLLLMPPLASAEELSAVAQPAADERDLVAHLAAQVSATHIRLVTHPRPAGRRQRPGRSRRRLRPANQRGPGRPSER